MYQIISESVTLSGVPKAVKVMIKQIVVDAAFNTDIMPFNEPQLC